MLTQYSFYTIIPEAFVYEKSEESTEISTQSWNSLFPEDVVANNTTPYIVDSGTTLLYIPTGKTSPRKVHPCKPEAHNSDT